MSTAFEESSRHTVQVKLRLRPDVAAAIRGIAGGAGVAIGDVVTLALEKFAASYAAKVATLRSELAGVERARERRARELRRRRSPKEKKS
jgi:predicted ATP-grasp superfamily ATP-dependent carboligase